MAWSVMPVIAAVGVFALILLIAGESPRRILPIFFVGAWGSSTAWSEALVKATSIALCALATAIPGRLGLINIGGEGQFLLGTIGATWAALSLSGGSPGLTLAAMVVAAVASGAVWGLIPGLLRAATGTSETVVSLMLNYVAMLMLLHLIHGPWRDPASLGWAQTAPFPDGALLGHFGNTRIHILVVVAMVAAAVLALAVRHLTIGISARVIHASPSAAVYAGIKPAPYYIAAFLIGGSLAGLAGFGEVSGVHGRLREGVSLGYGFAGFLVSWMCGNRFEWIPVISLVFGGLLASGDVLQIDAGLPFATVNVLLGLVFLAVLIFTASRRGTPASPAVERAHP